MALHEEHSVRNEFQFWKGNYGKIIDSSVLLGIMMMGMGEKGVELRLNE